MPSRTSKKPVAKATPAKAATRRPKRSIPPSPTLPSHKYLSGNALVCGDNLDVLKELPDECIDLIYLDPPFNSNHNYVAAFGDRGRVDAQLRDIWRWTVETENAYQRLPHGNLLNAVNAVRLVSGEQSAMSAYAVFMGRRLAELHRVLKPTGSIYLHCDDAASHYLRLLMDSIFSESNMQKFLVWRRATSHNDSQRYGRNADHILFYRKSSKVYWNGSAASTPKTDEQMATSYPSKDEYGRYRSADLTGASVTAGESGKKWKRYDVSAMGRHWAPPKTAAYAEFIEKNFIPNYKQIEGVHARLDALDKAGLIHHPTTGKWPGLKRYAAAEQGNPPQSIILEPTGFTNYNKR